MTWEQRATAGVDAKHFQAALAAKGGSRIVRTTSEALGRITAEGLTLRIDSIASELPVRTKPPGGGRYA